MREQGVTNVALAQRLQVSETVVRRLVHPDHDSKIERVEQALAMLSKHLVVEAD
jgi:antitoxin HicB